DRQHGVRRGVADRARDGADPAGDVWPPSLAAAIEPVDARRGSRSGTHGLVDPVRNDMVEHRAERLRETCLVARYECCAARDAPLVVAQVDLEDLLARL